METMKKFLKKVRVSTLVYAALVVVVLIFAASLVMTYAFPQSSAFALRLKDRLPYPAVIISYQSGITYRTLGENMAAIKRFYETQDFSKIGLRVDFSTDEGKRRFKVRSRSSDGCGFMAFSADCVGDMRQQRRRQYVGRRLKCATANTTTSAGSMR
jgi:hypothetical protein